jgi:hypothetical protein
MQRIICGIALALLAAIAATEALLVAPSLFQ